MNNMNKGRASFHKALTTEKEWQDAWPCMKSLRHVLELEKFLNCRKDFLDNGYQLFGCVEEELVVCIAGIIIYPHIVRGRDCWVYDLATIEDERSKGYGLSMLRFLEGYALEQGCSRVCVHTSVTKELAQHFYEEHAGYEKFAHVYTKTVSK